MSQQDMKAPARHFPWLYVVCAAALVASQASAADIDVKLTGIMKMSGTKKAMLVVKDRHCNLAEGESEGPIEVLRIDDRNKQVTIRASGRQMDLSFEKDGAPKIATAPANNVAGAAPAPQPLARQIPQAPAPQTQVPQTHAAQAQVPQIPQNAEAILQEMAEETTAGNPSDNRNNVIVIGRRTAPRSGPGAQRPQGTAPLTQPTRTFPAPTVPAQEQPG